MHFDGFGDIMKHQRFHRFLSMLQKTNLMLDDASCHFHERIVAALKTLKKPSRLLKIVFEVGVVCARITPLNQCCIVCIDAQFGCDIGVEFYAPRLCVQVFAYQNIRHDIGRCRGSYIGARLRIEALDKAYGRAQLGLFQAGLAHKLRVVSYAEQIDMLPNNELRRG